MTSDGEEMRRTPRVADWLAWMDEIAPFETAEPGDNVGLLCGDPLSKVERALLSVDLTEDVAREAIDLGVALVITHHPVMRSGVRALRWDDGFLRPSLLLLRAGIAHIAAHTNLDRADGGVSDALASHLGLAQIERDGYVRMGILDEISLDQLVQRVGKALGGSPRLYGDPKLRITRCAVCGGGGADEAAHAGAMGAQILITGDVRHHAARDALALGIPLIDAGHWETERVVLKPLADRLQALANRVQYKISIDISQRDDSPQVNCSRVDGGENAWI